jgi:hypothetical protein
MVGNGPNGSFTQLGSSANIFTNGL